MTAPAVLHAKIHAAAQAVCANKPPMSVIRICCQQQVDGHLLSADTFFTVCLLNFQTLESSQRDD
jgi:hypothetical protein